MYRKVKLLNFYEPWLNKEVIILISVSWNLALNPKIMGSAFLRLQQFRLQLNNKSIGENWDSKTPSVGTILAYLETTAYQE